LSTVTAEHCDGLAVEHDWDLERKDLWGWSLAAGTPEHCDG
jgi:hypothetical protein